MISQHIKWLDNVVNTDGCRCPYCGKQDFEIYRDLESYNMNLLTHTCLLNFYYGMSCNNCGEMLAEHNYYMSIPVDPEHPTEYSHAVWEKIASIDRRIFDPDLEELRDD